MLHAQSMKARSQIQVFQNSCEEFSACEAISPVSIDSSNCFLACMAHTNAELKNLAVEIEKLADGSNQTEIKENVQKMLSLLESASASASTASSSHRSSSLYSFSSASSTNNSVSQKLLAEVNTPAPPLTVTSFISFLFCFFAVRAIVEIDSRLCWVSFSSCLSVIPLVFLLFPVCFSFVLSVFFH